MDKIRTNMKHGKHFKEKSILKINSKGKHSKIKNNNNIVICKKMFIPITALLLLCIITGTSTYMIMKNSIKNVFIIGVVKPEIIETFDANNKIKKDVYIKNIGNVPIYIRTALIINWKDKDGKILGKPEENKDYSINLSTSTNWLKGRDGYYYYKNSLAEKNDTDILIEECIQNKEYEDKILEVTVAVQAIQADPSKAVIEAWNVDIIDNMLVLKE